MLSVIRVTESSLMRLKRYGLRAPGSSAALWSIGLALGQALAVAGPALAAPYDFVPAPQTDLNRIYRIDRVTGEVSSCQYGLQEGTVGATLCFGAGEGAGAQTPGEYGLVASRHEREGGVFRVNYRTGEMSICYVFDERVVCTPQTSPSTPKAVAGSAAASPAAPSATPAIRGAGASPQRP
jgi:hypothetical protein